MNEASIGACTAQEVDRRCPTPLQQQQSALFANHKSNAYVQQPFQLLGRESVSWFCEQPWRNFLTLSLFAVQSTNKILKEHEMCIAVHAGYNMKYSRAHVHTQPLRLAYLTSVLEEKAKEIGVNELRASSDKNLWGEATAEPSDESVAGMFNPIAMVLAHFGTQIPVGSKIKAAWLFVLRVNHSCITSQCDFIVCLTKTHFVWGCFSRAQRKLFAVASKDLAQRFVFLGRASSKHLQSALHLYSAVVEKDQTQLEVFWLLICSFWTLLCILQNQIPIIPDPPINLGMSQCNSWKTSWMLCTLPQMLPHQLPQQEPLKIQRVRNLVMRQPQVRLLKCLMYMKWSMRVKVAMGWMVVRWIAQPGRKRLKMATVFKLEDLPLTKCRLCPWMHPRSGHLAHGFLRHPCLGGHKLRSGLNV